MPAPITAKIQSWNTAYTNAPDGLFGTQPNDYVQLIANHNDFDARTALFIADGDGRNSRWLAGRRCDVTSLDSSNVAVENASRLDEKAGVTVTRHIADVTTWQRPAKQLWDAAFLIYLQAPQATRVSAIKLAWNAIRAGGWFVLEGFTKGKPSGSPGPSNEDLLYDLDEIKTAITDVHLVEAVRTIIDLNEGTRHQGPAHVIRYTARKQ